MSNSADNNIDWPGFLKHMQGMEKRIKKDLIATIGKFEDVMTQRFDVVGKRFDDIDKRLERLEQDVFILIAHKSAHEERLDAIENVKLPKINKSIRNMQKRFRSDTKQKSHSAVQA